MKHHRLLRTIAIVCVIVFGSLTILHTAQAASSLSVSIMSGGTDSTQQSQFNFIVKNVSSAAVSNISVHVYFTVGTEAASNYVFEKYWDQSGVATVSGPTQQSGSSYYFTVSFGSTALAAGSSWQFNTSLHLSDWTNNLTPASYWYHTGYALGALPSSATVTNYIPAYVSGTLNVGSEPGGSTSVPPTNTPVTGPTATHTNTATTGPSLTPSRTSTRTNTPTTGPTLAHTNTPTTGPTATRTNTPVATNTPTFGVTVTSTVAPTKTPTQGPTSKPGTHASNPFTVSPWFHNPAWDAEVNASSVASNIKSDMTQYNTAVWLDSMAAVNGTNGYPYSITGWLNQAVSQGAKLIIFVVYDLPERDCAALASNGEIPGTAAGLTTYETDYINPIAAAEGSAAYSGINIINIVEPDSLPNLVTNTGIANCQTANGLYQPGIEYALNMLHPITNTYNYIDIGHSGWLGWSSNFSPAITLISGVIKATTAGASSVDGFISDTANTVPVTEPYLTATESIGGSEVESVTFYSYNPYIEEDTYDAAWATAMQGAGLGTANTNMLVDTSRNGWGGCSTSSDTVVSQPCRPTAVSTATDVNTFVTMSRIDRRPARGDWCNQDGAGVGARPGANPGGPYQAYVWIKPQGESDGSSSLVPTGTSNPGGKGFDRMCDPTYGGNSLNQNSPTNALPNAPVSGAWFEAQFEQLTANAYPALP